MSLPGGTFSFSFKEHLPLCTKLWLGDKPTLHWSGHWPQGSATAPSATAWPQETWSDRDLFVDALQRSSVGFLWHQQRTWEKWYNRDKHSQYARAQGMTAVTSHASHACLTPTRDGSEDNLQFLRMRGNIKYRTDGVDSAPSDARHLVWLLAPDNGNQQHGRNKASGDQSPFNQWASLLRRAWGCLGALSYSSAGNRGCGSRMIPN